jgi:predicted nuclease with RNAse H fold
VRLLTQHQQQLLHLLVPSEEAKKNTVVSISSPLTKQGEGSVRQAPEEKIKVPMLLTGRMPEMSRNAIDR